MIESEEMALKAPMNAGLLVLRIGAGVALGMLFVWGRFPNAAVAGISGHSWAIGIIAICCALTVFGLATRLAAGFLAAIMAFAAVWGLRTGQQPLEEPVRAVMFVVLYAALAFTGPGTQSLEFLMARTVRARTDAGLLVLRMGAGLSLFCCFGLTKIGWIVALAHTPGPWSAWRFAQLIGSVGLPAPLTLAFCAVLNETVTPLFIASGFLTRPAAAIGAFGMAGALYTSLRIGEEPVRAAVYVVAFATLTLTGPGKYAVDQILERKAAARASRATPPRPRSVLSR